MNSLAVQKTLSYGGASALATLTQETDMLTLPASHSRPELDLARRVASRFDSEELHVFWTGDPERVPDEPEKLTVFGLAMAAMNAFFDSLTSTLTNLGRRAARS